MKLFFHGVVVVMWSSVAAPTFADVMSFSLTARPESRLADNPKAFDRVDQFCSDKKIGDACVISGEVFAGGGEGICLNKIVRINEYMMRSGTIDLLCVRKHEPVFERQLPCHADGVTWVQRRPDQNLPADVCEELLPVPTDQFCIGKKIDSACMATFTYQGKLFEQLAGVCKESYQIVGKLRDRTVRRQEVRCESSTPTELNMIELSWWEKLFQ